jgi:hypothetical protein
MRLIKNQERAKIKATVGGEELAQLNLTLGRLTITSKVTRDERDVWLHLYNSGDAPIWCVRQVFAGQMTFAQQAHAHCCGK